MQPPLLHVLLLLQHCERLPLHGVDEAGGELVLRVLVLQIGHAGLHALFQRLNVGLIGTHLKFLNDCLEFLNGPESVDVLLVLDGAAFLDGHFLNSSIDLLTVAKVCQLYLDTFYGSIAAVFLNLICLIVVIFITRILDVPRLCNRLFLVHFLISKHVVTGLTVSEAWNV